MNRQKQAGFLLIELAVVLAVMAISLYYLAHQKALQMEESKLSSTATNIVQYVQAVANYMADNAATLQDSAYSGESHSGVSWLQPASCGGTASKPYLPCSITNASFGYGLSPSVSIQPGPPWPKATIDWGNVQKDAGKNFGEGYVYLKKKIREIAQNLHVTSYFSVLPPTPPNTDLAIELDFTGNDIWLRTDGSNQMNGKLIVNNAGVFKSDDWAIIAQDGSGSDNAAAATSAGSIVANDLYIRSAAVWMSDVYLLAKDAYTQATEAKRMAEESIRFETAVSHGDTVNKPSCPSGMTPQIFMSQNSAISTMAAGQAKSIVAYEARAIDNGASWSIVLRLLTSDGIWHNITSSLGYATARVKCSR